MFALLLTQTLLLAFRKGGGAFGTMGFYVIVVTLFTFGLGPQAMTQHAGAVMCVALLLAAVTALPLLYERDFEDGTLEQLLLQPQVLEMLVLAKITGQWAAHILPMLAVSPLLAVMANLSMAHTADIMLRLALASVSIAALGSIAAALTLGSRRGGLLQALVVMPLTVPILIFAAVGGHGAIWFLSGLLFALLPLSCFVSAALVRLSVD